MLYRQLGKTGLKVSALGFGVLRIPKKSPSNKAFDIERGVEMVRQAIDGGVNFIDTAYNYMNGKSELIVGKALKEGYRDKVTLMTKCPIWAVSSAEDFHLKLDEQLERLDVDFVDIYLFHNISKNRFAEKIVKLNLIDEMKKAKKMGKIKHIGFSSHDKPKNIKKYIDTGVFEVILVQYNFLDRSNQDIIQYANENGLGIAIMGPVGGGRLAMEPTKEMEKWLTKGRKDFADLALKFVLSNPNISVVLSGMSSEKIIEENIALASHEKSDLTEDESKRIDLVSKKFQEIYDIDCTQCGYCMPCPNDVNIKAILKQLMVSRDPLKLHLARAKYRGIGLTKSQPGQKSPACTECKECLEKCPQEIPIIERIKEAHAILSEQKS